MKTTKGEYERFKGSFLKWQEKFSKLDYKIYFQHVVLVPNDSYARIETNITGRVATVNFNANIDDDAYKEWEGPETSGRHEAIHLLIARLAWLGGCRYIDSEEIGEEDEAIVRILEKVLETEPAP